MPELADREPLCQLQAVYREALGPSLAGWTLADDLHLTLCFFGDLEHACATELHAVCSKWLDGAAPTLVFQRIEAWPRATPRLLVARFEASAALAELATRATHWSQAHGLAVDPRAYCPHVTLLRARQPLPRLPLAKLAGFQLPARRVALMHRHRDSAMAARYVTDWSMPWPPPVGADNRYPTAQLDP